MHTCLPASAAPTATCRPRSASVTRSLQLGVGCSSWCFSMCSSGGAILTQAALWEPPSRAPSSSTMRRQTRLLICANSQDQAQPCSIQGQLPARNDQTASSFWMPVGLRHAAWPSASLSYVGCQDLACPRRPVCCLVCGKAAPLSRCPRQSPPLQRCTYWAKKQLRNI